MQQLRLARLRDDAVRRGLRLLFAATAYRLKHAGQLGGAAGQDEPRLRSGAPQAQQGRACVTFAFCGDGAAVDTDDVRRGRVVAFLAALTLPGFAQGLTFVLIDLAAEGQQMKFPCAHAVL